MQQSMSSNSDCLIVTLLACWPVCNEVTECIQSYNPRNGVLCVKHVHCTCLMYIIPESKLFKLHVCDVAFIFLSCISNIAWAMVPGLCVHAPGIITYIVPCYTAGKNAEAVEESCLKYGIYSLIPLANIYCHATVRGKIREKKNIEVSHLMAYTRYKFMCVCSYFVWGYMCDFVYNNGCIFITQFSSTAIDG